MGNVIGFEGGAGSSGGGSVGGFGESFVTQLNAIPARYRAIELALQLAETFKATRTMNTEDVLASSKKIEAYLNGDGETP